MAVVVYNVLCHCLLGNNSFCHYLFPYTRFLKFKVWTLEPAQDTREDNTYEDTVPRYTDNIGDMKPAKGEVQLNLAKYSEELKSRFSIMDSKLREVKFR